MFTSNEDTCRQHSMLFSTSILPKVQVDHLQIFTHLECMFLYIISKTLTLKVLVTTIDAQWERMGM